VFTASGLGTNGLKQRFGGVLVVTSQDVGKDRERSGKIRIGKDQDRERLGSGKIRIGKDWDRERLGSGKIGKRLVERDDCPEETSRGAR
jgi:hypothetical protein